MANKTVPLIERREKLIRQAAEQRRILAINVELWRTPVAQVDQGLAVLRVVRRHSTTIAGILASILALRPGLLGKWLARGWLAAKVIGKLRSK